MRRTPIIGSLLILGLALTACGAGAPPSPSSDPASVPSSVSPEPSTPVSVPPSASPPPSAPSESPSGGLGFSEAGRFDEEGDAIVLVDDVTAWSGGFIAVGRAFPEGNVATRSELRAWTSADGRAWEAVSPDVDPTAQVAAVARLATGGVLVIGTVGATDPQVAMWRSTDGTTWNEVDPPSDWTGVGLRATSGPIGIVVASANRLWYSADGESWQAVLELSSPAEFGPPAAGDEGFVVHASAGETPVTYASGDGLTWTEGSPENVPYQVSSWRGDWLGWVPTSEPGTFTVVRSADGLEWTPVLDETDFPDLAGRSAADGEEPVTHAEVHGEGSVLVLTLGFNHCCAQPPLGIDVLTSEDGETWADAGLPDSAYVTALATDGEVVVLAGHLDRGPGGAAFWVADR